MTREKAIDEQPGGDEPGSGAGSGSPSPDGPNDDVDLRSMSCSDLEDLVSIIAIQVAALISRLDDIPKLRFMQRRMLQLEIKALWHLGNGAQLEMVRKGCP